MSSTNIMKGLVALTLVIGIGVSVSEARGFHKNRGDRNGPVRASAEIFDCTNTDIQLGWAQLKEEKTDEGIKEVKVMMAMRGLTPGNHAVHIHENASCVPCGDAQGHFDPGPVGLSSPDGNHPFHSGDLINIEANRRGRGYLSTTTTRVTLSPGPLTIFDENGSAFIVHVNPDTYCPDGVVAGCAGGARAACGIITKDAN